MSREERPEALARFLERCRARHGVLQLSCLKAQARPRIAESGKGPKQSACRRICPENRKAAGKSVLSPGKLFRQASLIFLGRIADTQLSAGRAQLFSGLQ